MSNIVNKPTDRQNYSILTIVSNTTLNLLVPFVLSVGDVYSSEHVKHETLTRQIELSKLLNQNIKDI